MSKEDLDRIAMVMLIMLPEALIMKRLGDGNI